MKILFGLGNPGENFVRTRHNTGFLTLDALASQQGSEFKDKSKFFAHVAETSVDGEQILLVKPQTFYNDAGRSYRAVIDFYKVDPTDTLVIHDELALPFGTIRSRLGGSDAGNNGIKSVNQHGGDSSARLRVGIANEQRVVMGDTDFVLGKFNSDEQEAFQTILLPKLFECINEFACDNHLHTSFTLIDKRPDQTV
jgi:peptidyl-tRNA hydrolase, PTH1 family